MIFLLTIRNTRHTSCHDTGTYLYMYYMAALKCLLAESGGHQYVNMLLPKEAMVTNLSPFNT